MLVVVFKVPLLLKSGGGEEGRLQMDRLNRKRIPFLWAHFKPFLVLSSERANRHLQISFAAFSLSSSKLRTLVSKVLNSYSLLRVRTDTSVLFSITRVDITLKRSATFCTVKYHARVRCRRPRRSRHGSRRVVTMVRGIVVVVVAFDVGVVVVGFFVVVVAVAMVAAGLVVFIVVAAVIVGNFVVVLLGGDQASPFSLIFFPIRVRLWSALSLHSRRRHKVTQNCWGGTVSTGTLSAFWVAFWNSSSIFQAR